MNFHSCLVKQKKLKISEALNSKIQIWIEEETVSKDKENIPREIWFVHPKREDNRSQPSTDIDEYQRWLWKKINNLDLYPNKK